MADLARGGRVFWIRRVWFPRFGGRRQCVECGFLTAYVWGDDPETGEPTESWDGEVRQYLRRELIEGQLRKRPEHYEFRCFRGVWSTTQVDDKDRQTLRYRPCTLYFPHHPAVSPSTHVELKNQAGFRWWGFWAVLAATMIGGTVSGLISSLF